MPVQRFALPCLMAPLALLVACAPPDITPTEPFALDGVSLVVEPLAQAECQADAPYAVRVRWNVIDWGDPKFDFHIGSTKGTLWSRVNTAAGEQTSDAFVRPGTWFVMLDREGRQLVAATPAPALACPEAP